ncbi:hypothetical protein L7F22_002594 [Adiantum nelumboides]|nr:hypothetical protein [Adiantum nelumboides]
MTEYQLAPAAGAACSPQSRWKYVGFSCGRGHAASFCSSWQQAADRLRGWGRPAGWSRLAGAPQSIRATAIIHAPGPAPLMGGSANNCSAKWAMESGPKLLHRPELRMQPSVEELASIKTPALVCSFASEMHPLYEQVRAPSDRWIEAVAELPTAAARRFLRDCLLPRLVCRFIPQALPAGRRLPQAIQLIAWLMIADDDDDNPEVLGCNYGATSYRAERIMSILTQPADAFHDHRLWNFDLLNGRISMRCSRQLAALADLWRELSPAMSPLLRSRFTSSMADYLDGIKMQAVLRKAGQVPDMKSYMAIRRQASFTIPAFIIAEYASGVELDHAAVQNPKVVELCNKAVDYVSLCNDIFSCYKEILSGDYFNLPSILYMHALPLREAARPCASFQDAIDHVAELALELEASCTSLIASLKEEYSKPDVDPLQAHHVHAYANVISLGMSGALAWFFETPRYPLPCTLDPLN